MKISKRVVAMILSFSIVLVNGEKIISYALNNGVNKDINIEARTINNTDLKEVDKYKKNKIKLPKLYSYNDMDLSEEAIDDLNALWNISYLQKKTDSKYEVALAYENGDYAYLDSTETIEDAMEIANAKSNSIDHNIIPVVIDENGLVIYATEGIGKIVKIIDGKPVSEKDTTKTALIYKTSTTTAEYAAINHAFVDDVPIIEDNGKRVKIQVNGLIGWIDKEDKTGVNIITVPINQSTNLSYYKKTSSGSLQHYISYDVEQSNAGHIKTVGIAPSFMEVNKNYYSYDGKYFYTNINILISDLKNNTANNAINKNNPYYNYYTYLSGRSKVSYYAKEIENYIQNNTEKDSVLRGQGINFIKAQNKYGVNASLMLGIAMNESSKGTSDLAKKKNNIYGIKAYDSNTDAATTFNSIEECIDRFASHYMSNLYLNPNYNLYSGSNLGDKETGMNVRYATDPFWGEKASEFMYEIDRYISGSDSLIEYNKYQLALFKSENEVTDSSGTLLYKVLKNRSKSAQVGDPVILLAEKLNKYSTYPGRQYPTNVSNPNPGSFDWSKLGYINNSGIEKINIKNDDIRVNTNTKPNISTSDVNISLGDKFDAKLGVTSSDTEDGNLTSKVIIKSSTVNTSKLGTYKVVYEVTDTDGNTVNKERKVIVNNVFTNFTVDNISSKSTKISGKGVSGATVKAYIGTKQIGNSATVNSSGIYNITIPAQSANTKITVKISKSGYTNAQKSITVTAIGPTSKRTLTKDINRYDAGKNNHLTFINGQGYSQYVYLNKSGNYAFTPSSWMERAGLNISMPTASNKYTMMIDNHYITMYNEANELLKNIKSGKISKVNIENELNKIESIKTEDINIVVEEKIDARASVKVKLTDDIYRYDAGKNNHLTYINGKGFSQYIYLTKDGRYAFTPSSWMEKAGLTVTMPTKSNGYTMKITNSYINKYNNVVNQIKSYL